MWSSLPDKWIQGPPLFHTPCPHWPVAHSNQRESPGSLSKHFGMRTTVPNISYTECTKILLIWICKKVRVFQCFQGFLSCKHIPKLKSDCSAYKIMIKHKLCLIVRILSFFCACKQCFLFMWFVKCFFDLKMSSIITLVRMYSYPWEGKKEDFSTLPMQPDHRHD